MSDEMFIECHSRPITKLNEGNVHLEQYPQKLEILQKIPSRKIQAVSLYLAISQI